MPVLNAMGWRFDLTTVDCDDNPVDAVIWSLVRDKKLGKTGRGKTFDAKAGYALTYAFVHAMEPREYVGWLEAA